MRGVIDKVVAELLAATRSDPQPKKSSAYSLGNLIQRSGRLNYDSIKTIASTHDIHSFCEIVEKPVLAGASLFQATMIAKNKTQDDATFLAAISETKGGSSIKKAGALETAIYPLIKTVNVQVEHVFVIGRSSDNDIVIPDYSVSRRHAHIRADETGKFFIGDHDSTNGTVVNGVTIKKGDCELELAPLDQIIFGRYEFLFLTPPYFYAKLLNLDYASLKKK